MVINKERKFTIFFVVAGTRSAPATRYRVYQYLPFLEKQGIRYEVYSLISEKMTMQMISSPTFNKLRKFIYYMQLVIEKFIRGCEVIRRADEFDIVFLQRATFPLGLEKLLKKKNKKIVFDIDDSIYMPDIEENKFLAWLKKIVKRNEVVSVLRISNCVIVENNYIKSFVQKYCNNVQTVTGPIDTIRNYAKQTMMHSDEVTIGWIGSPSTTHYLKIVDRALRELSRRSRIKLLLVGASPYYIEGVKVEQAIWNEDTEVSMLHKFDIGIMPMPDNEWTRGKVGCKMLQYMANAIPSVVSYTPTNAEVIEDGVNGFIVESEKKWVESLSSLIEDSGLRCSIGMAGRMIVEKRYSLAENGTVFFNILNSIYKDSPC